MGFIGQLGMQAASGAINTGMGLLLEKHNDKRQLEQQGKLGQQQLGFSNQHAKYQSDLALERWEKTNYGAQLAEMKKAGLSPGLMYGGSGAGGAMSSGGGGGSIGGGQAPAGGNEIMGLQLMGAQKRLLEAQAENVQADTGLKEADTGLRGKQTDIAELERSMLNDSYDVTYSKLQAEASKLESEAQSAYANKEVDKATVETRIKQQQGELIGLGLANELKEKGVQLTEEKVKQTVAAVQQKWREIAVQEGKLNLDRFVKDVSDSTGGS